MQHFNFIAYQYVIARAGGRVALSVRCERRIEAHPEAISLFQPGDCFANQLLAVTFKAIGIIKVCPFTQLSTAIH